MAVREFDGVDDVIKLDNGTVGAWNASGGTGLTVMLVCKPTNLTSPDCYFGSSSTTTDAGNGLGALYGNDGSTGMAWGSDDPAADSVVANGLTSGTWQMLGMDKAAGTVAPRMHRKPIGSGSWSHANGGTTVGSSATSVAMFLVSRFANTGVGGEWKAQRVAVAAVWTRQLPDSEYVSIESAASTQAIKNSTPAALWEFNQASTATNVTDLMGNGADQIGITGTTVIADGVDDPAWTFGTAAAAPADTFTPLPFMPRGQ